LTATFAPGPGKAARGCSRRAAAGRPEQAKSLAREMKYLGAVLQGVGLEQVTSTGAGWHEQDGSTAR